MYSAEEDRVAINSGVREALFWILLKISRGSIARPPFLGSKIFLVMTESNPPVCQESRLQDSLR